MHYQTIVLELLQQRPPLYDQLRKDRKLLPALQAYARELQRKHAAWMEELRPLRPNSDPSQIDSEALELALEELQEALPSASPPGAEEPLSLDAAMAFIRNHTPPA